MESMFYNIKSRLFDSYKCSVILSLIGMHESGGNWWRWLARSGTHVDYKHVIASITDNNPVEQMQHVYQLHWHPVSDSAHAHTVLYTHIIFL